MSRASGTASKAISKSSLQNKQLTKRRGLINARSNPNGHEFNEGEVVDSKFVVAGCDAPTLLDLVEETFDQIRRGIEIARPYLLGGSRHGALDRKTQKIPLRMRRSSTRATPAACLEHQLDEPPFVVAEFLMHDPSLRLGA